MKQEVVGLSLSLDQLVDRERASKSKQKGPQGQQQGRQGDDRGRGRGRAKPGRGAGGARGPPGRPNAPRVLVVPRPGNQAGARGRGSSNAASRQQQYRAQQSRPAAAAHAPGRPTTPSSKTLRKVLTSFSPLHGNMECLEDGDTGGVVVLYKEETILAVSPEGSLRLDRGTLQGAELLQCFRDVLSVLDLKVNGRPDAEWMITDGLSMHRFQDGMVLQSKGPQHVGRARALLEAFGHPAARTMAAAEAGSDWMGSGSGAGRVWGQPGGADDGEDAAAAAARAQRRLQAQGRYQPY